jgi:hypothetical protein
MTIVKRKVESTPKKYVKYSELKPGATVVVGNYLGSPLVPNFAKDGEVPEHQFQDEDGNITALNSAGQLNFLLAKVEIGSLVEVLYLGKESITRKNGQKTKANQFEVSILEEQSA